MGLLGDLIKSVSDVMTSGRRQDGTWYRGTIFDPWQFVSDAGEQILFSPGQTWVHMIPTTWTVPSN